jgi:excisionase family DNA binding protein
MQVITIEAEAFQQILKRLEAINEKLISQKPTTPLSEVWLDNQEVCELLHISKRTLQHYRDSKLLPFSQIGSKVYYKATDVETHLNNHYKQTKS